MPNDNRNLFERIRSGFNQDISSMGTALGFAGIDEAPKQVNNLIGPNETIDRYKLNLARAGAYRNAPESYRKSLPADINKQEMAGINEQEMNRLRSGLEQHNQYLAKQKEMQNQRIQQAVGLKSKKVIETDPTGKQTIKQNFKVNDGTEITIKSQENPYQKQYEEMLQEGMQRNTDINLQPIAQLVDQWTGSRFAPGMSQQRQEQEQEKIRRANMAGALATEGQKPIDRAESKRRWEEEMNLRKLQLAARLRAAGAKTDKRKDLVRSLDIGKARAIENTALRDQLRRQDIFPKVERGLSNDEYLKSKGINIPSGWDEPLALIAKTANVQDISVPKKAMIQTMINNARARGWSWDKIEDKIYDWEVKVDTTLENIRNAYEKIGQ
jgi:hypothetical protein